MLFASVIFGFGLAQVFIQRDVFSRNTKFWFGIAAVILSGIPLLLQFSVILAELTRLPFSYWTKLQVHRLLISIMGYHGPARSFAVDYGNNIITSALHPSNFSASLLSRMMDNCCTSSHARWWINLNQHLCKVPSCLLFSFRLLILFILGIWVVPLNFVVMVVELFVIQVFLTVLHYFTKLLSIVSFNDAFSGMYHVRTVSLAVWLVDEQDFHSFFDSRGRKVISKWDYPHVPEEATRMILRDLDLDRMKMLKRLKWLKWLNEPSRPSTSLERGESSEQGRLNLDGLLKREENLRWEVLGKPHWAELFQREESFRWEILNGMELAEELFKLEKLKLELKRLEPREQLGRIKQTEQTDRPDQPEQPLGLELMSRLRVKRKQYQLKHLEQEEMQLNEQSRGRAATAVFRTTSKLVLLLLFQLIFFGLISYGVTNFGGRHWWLYRDVAAGVPAGASTTDVVDKEAGAPPAEQNGGGFAERA